MIYCRAFNEFTFGSTYLLIDYGIIIFLCMEVFVYASKPLYIMYNDICFLEEKTNIKMRQLLNSPYIIKTILSIYEKICCAFIDIITIYILMERKKTNVMLIRHSGVFLSYCATIAIYVFNICAKRIIGVIYKGVYEIMCINKSFGFTTLINISLVKKIFRSACEIFFGSNIIVVDNLQKDQERIDNLFKLYFLKKSITGEILVLTTPNKHNISNNEKECDELQMNLDESNLCKICYINKINIVMIPCGHIACCSGCINLSFKNNHKSCPVCRGSVANLVNIYFV